VTAGGPLRPPSTGPSRAERAQSVVAFGGGHGLAATLQAMRRLVADLVVDDLTAIVTVADNGGSSGRLRAEFGVLPPGDLRMALAALCDDRQWGDTWARVLQHRFAGQGEMNGHVIGNLLIVGLWEQLGDPVAALDWVGRLLGTAGRVLPMALTPLDITAEVRGLDGGAPDALTTVRGQVQVATVDGVIDSIALDPPEPDPCPQAIAAVQDADWLVLGPGSWFTSVIPHLMVPALREAIVASAGRVVVTLNLTEQAGETRGFEAADHLAVLAEHAPDLKIHTVLADERYAGEGLADLRHLVAASGAELVLADVASDDGTARHDPEKLAAAYVSIMERG
jgi:uncharacterized cofD-like protein